MKKNSRGFTLIELLIVVAIILIISAIAIPNLMSSKKVANQVSAVASLKAIRDAEATYQVTFGGGFSATLSALGAPSSGNPTPTAAGLIDSLLAGGTKAGYHFVYSATQGTSGTYDSYTVQASPITPGTTGQIYYYVDQAGTIRQNTTQPASAADSPIGG